MPPNKHSRFNQTGIPKVNNSQNAKIIDVTADNVEQTGFFCYMSKPKTEGYQRKLNWIKARFPEGMRIKMLELPLRGFIEYIPGEYAWRSVNASGYIFIHCLWVVGKSRGKGLAGVLLEECINDARAAGLNGVAMVTSERIWLAGKQLLLKQGFVSVAEVPPFNLMVKKFNDAPDPSFTGDWEQKASRLGDGLTVVYSDQCPYIPDATNAVLEFAQKRNIPFRALELKSSHDVRQLAPSPYGVFSIAYNGKLLAYHYLLPKDLEKLLP
ncbi:GNAT family N-acetyltransferase [candidate division KSB1 bacterium]|nr:GNAT family N-acetyltransferase [candidate division KSB1 bacterium]